MGLSLLGILAYIAFRFQFSFAVGAVVATCTICL
jgi:preprotein translocase subunit SecF